MVMRVAGLGSVGLGEDAHGLGMDAAMSDTRRRPSRVDRIRQTYGFDDVSLAPGTRTVEPADVDVSVDIAGIHLDIPILAAAMDAVVDVRSAGALRRLGGLAGEPGHQARVLHDGRHGRPARRGRL